MINQKTTPIFIGDTIQQQLENDVKGEFVSLLGDKFYKIQNYDRLTPFFMSIVTFESLALHLVQRRALGWQGQCRTIFISLLHR